MVLRDLPPGGIRIISKDFKSMVSQISFWLTFFIWSYLLVVGKPEL